MQPSSTSETRLFRLLPHNPERRSDDCVTVDLFGCKSGCVLVTARERVCELVFVVGEDLRVVPRPRSGDICKRLVNQGTPFTVRCIDVNET
jgi:hypothetical protein